jgi:ADP-ribose pyrophosphatase YjhB (NUDIX family)
VGAIRAVGTTDQGTGGREPGLTGFSPTYHRSVPVTSPARRRGGRREETSAGGLVVDGVGTQARAALIGRIDRRGKLAWSLPKGHVEPGESFEAAAVREVAEETGIDGEVLAPLGVIDFWFVADGDRVHKTVHHFLLRARGGELSDDDIEVAEVAWVPLADVAGRLAYPTERKLLAQVPDLLAGADIA